MTSPQQIDHHKHQPYAIDRQQVGGRPQSWFVVHCGACPATERIHLHVNMTPEAVKHKFRNRDWVIERHHADGHRCPTCRRAAQPAPTSKKETPVMANNVTALPAGSAAPGSAAVRDATPLEMRRIFALVEGHFDEAKGCYTGGYTDERVARELGLPRALITRVREESGLKIKGNPEVIALRADIDGLKDLLSGLETRCAALEKAAR
jgi:hypothetical protein